MRAAGWGVCAALVLGLAAGVTIGGCVHRAPSTSPQKNEITALWTQIRDWRLEAGWSVEPTDREIMGAPTTTERARAVCPLEKPAASCGDICDISEAICDNAERICDLSKELRGDSWADDKCKSANASCKLSRQRCCKCNAQAVRGFLRGNDEDREN
jgi:hypothetical protein